MSDPILMALVSVVIVSLVSFIGVITLALKEARLQKILVYLVGFSVGALLGDAFIHLLPEVVEESGFGIGVSFSILLGIVVSFMVEKVVHWRHRHTASQKSHPHPFAYMNLFGDAVHNFIDGLIIAASYMISIPVGVATTIAVVFHEIPQEMGDFGVLLHGGFTRKNAILVNFLSALLAVAGALTAIFLSAYTEKAVVFFASFAVGGFVYIAGTDLMPELHRKFSVRASVQQVISIILGIGVMYALLLLE